jgi:hypothetical protein
VEYCRRSETARQRVRKERERERKRQKKQREVTVRRVSNKAKRSLSLYTELGMDLQGSELKEEKYMHSFGGCTYVCLLQKLE